MELLKILVNLQDYHSVLKITRNNPACLIQEQILLLN
jgi:hypothetical protein